MQTMSTTAPGQLRVNRSVSGPRSMLCSSPRLCDLGAAHALLRRALMDMPPELSEHAGYGRVRSS